MVGKLGRKCTYNLIFRRERATIVVVEQ